MLTTIREVHRFDTFAELVATADAIAIIRVGALNERTFDDPDGGLVTVYTLTADVEELLAGSEIPAQVKIVFDFAYAESARKGTGLDWTVIGRRVWIALHEREDMSAYRPLNRQSVFVISADGHLAAVWRDPLTATLDGRSVSTTRAAIDEAKRAIDAGLLTPKPERPVSKESP